MGIMRPMHAGERKVRYKHAPFAETILRTREEAERELETPCGRFSMPKKVEERLGAFITERVRDIDPLSKGQLFAGSAIPLNWQRLLQHLHASGIIRDTTFHYPHTTSDRPKLLNLGLFLNKTSRPTDGHTRGYGAYGTGDTLEEAMSKTIGEALERYFFSVYKRETLLKSSYRSLAESKTPALDIGALNGFLPFQKDSNAHRTADENSELSWVEARTYPSGKKILVPAQLVYWNFQHESPAGVLTEHMLARSTTSGCAGHFTREEAVHSALLELIERDGFLIHWLNRISPPRLDVSKIADPRLVDLLAYLKRYRFEAQFLNTTTDIGVPSITCVLTDTSSENDPSIAVGASAGFDLPQMLIHAATEAILVSTYASLQPSYALEEPYVPFMDASIDRTKRLTLWRGTKMRDAFAFFLSGRKQDAAAMMRDVPDDPHAFVLDQLARMGTGYEVLVCDAVDPVLTDLGYHVVRTIVPQLVPLYLVESTALLDSRRLREVPGALGYTAARDYNPLPHPFP